jgi:hypothetical protein
VSFKGPGELIQHADAKRGHIVEEEFVHVIRRNDQDHIRLCLVELLGEALVAVLKLRYLFRIAEVQPVDDKALVRCRETETEFSHPSFSSLLYFLVQDPRSSSL